jgi:hypothetical protein
VDTSPLAFVVYPPPSPEDPWLAVVLDGERVVDIYTCPAEEAAEQYLLIMHGWREEKRGRVAAVPAGPGAC